MSATVARCAIRGTRGPAVSFTSWRHSLGPGAPCCGARGPPLELPDWLFDRAVCGRMRLTATPVASTESLLALRALLRAAGSATRDRDPVQERHRPTRNSGDADAT